MTAALEGGEWSAARTSGTLPPGKTHFTGSWVIRDKNNQRKFQDKYIRM